MHSDNMIPIVQKNPQVPFFEGIFIKDKEKQEPMTYWCLVVVWFSVFP